MRGGPRHHEPRLGLQGRATPARAHLPFHLRHVHNFGAGAGLRLRRGAMAQPQPNRQAEKGTDTA